MDEPLGAPAHGQEEGSGWIKPAWMNQEEPQIIEIIN
jgi:hypothetical protein